MKYTFILRLWEKVEISNFGFQFQQTDLEICLEPMLVAFTVWVPMKCRFVTEISLQYRVQSRHIEHLQSEDLAQLLFEFRKKLSQKLVCNIIFIDY